MTQWREDTIHVGGVDVVVVRGGSGKPLLVLHDELGYTGWMRWNARLAQTRELIMPLQPGFGRTPPVEWLRSYRDLAGFYARLLREQQLTPLDVMGFSAGGYIAAEMAACEPQMFAHMILVAPMGLRPAEGEIFDFFAVTIRSHLLATVADAETPEFGEIYGGEMTPEQFEAFEDARAETARLGWEPFMHNPSLGHLLEGVHGLPTLLIWGDQDAIVPKACISAYAQAIRGATIHEIPGVGHRPEIENCDAFVTAVQDFLTA